MHIKKRVLEAELGNRSYSDIGETEINLTDPEEAREMQEQTQVDWLAVSVGNIHRLATRKVPFNFLFCSKLNTNANYLW